MGTASSSPACRLSREGNGADLVSLRNEDAYAVAHDLKDRLDPECVPSFTIEQTEPGITTLIAQLVATGQPVSQIHVAMEATGTYWMRLASRLYQAGFAVSVVNPSQAYHYAQAWLQRAKTDELDAQTLARLAWQMEPELWVPDPALYEELEQRLVEREVVVNY
jgi:transposase